MTDVELDGRVTALEKNGGGGNTQNGNKLCYGDLWFLDRFLASKFSKVQFSFCIKEYGTWFSDIIAA